MTLVHAIYEAGVFRPLEPVRLSDQQRVSLLISESSPSDESAQLACEELERSFQEVSVPFGGKLWTNRDELYDR